jgi:hypothetical protein
MSPVMTDLTLTPGALTLDQLLAVHAGGTRLVLDAAARRPSAPVPRWCRPPRRAMRPSMA